MNAVLDLRPIVPAAIVAVTGVVVLLAQAFTPKGKRAPSSAAVARGPRAARSARCGCSAAGAAEGAVLGGRPGGRRLRALPAGAGPRPSAIVTVLLSPGYLRANGMERGEYYALLLFSVVGMLGLVSSLELVSMFVALEIMSVALYGMAGLDRARPREPGVGAQVLRHRRLRLGLLPLRHRARLRRHRQHLARARRARARRRRARTASRSPLLGRGLPAGGLRLQGRERAVPHVGARRLRGRADHR